MDHNMVLSYDYSSQIRRRWRTNAPPLRAKLMAMVVRRCNMERIAQCSMIRASPEATGCCHWATTRSVLPRRPPERQHMVRRCKMNPLCWSSRWPWQCVGTIPHTLTNGGGSWLSEKPLNATIGRAVALIASIGHANAC